MVNDSAAIIAPVSVGELIDKITILRIKSARVTDSAKLHNVRHELELLENTQRECVPASAKLEQLTADLQHVNELLWDVEDDIRICERDADFGPKFIDLARSVYRFNDRRCEIKREINLMLGSSLVEEKAYTVQQQ